MFSRILQLIKDNISPEIWQSIWNVIVNFWNNRKNRKDKDKSKDNTKDGTTHNLTVPKKKKKRTKHDQALTEARDFSYKDDELFKANNYSKATYDKYIVVIHFSWTKSLEGLTNYFHKSARSNSTWGVGKDGTTYRYLPNPKNPSYTQGLKVFDKGGFINKKGKWIKQVNNVACGFEVVNRNLENYTEAQYKAVAVRLLWMLDYFPNFRLWFVTGHEQIVPMRKNDPGIKWDWKKLFVTYCGVRKDFYNEYLIYLEETSSYSTVGDKDRSKRKLLEVKEGVGKIQKDLIGKQKEYCF